ncbi:MAG: nickel-dependent lactate racemase [Chloroflexi bacterium]|nr:nickel-dependent lactate racemase [Chloroflexota bacterium]
MDNVARPDVFVVPYGRSHLSFSLPDGVTGTLIESRSLPPIADVSAAVRQLLASPTNSRPLRELARPGSRACIVVTDVTRACPDHLLVPPILEELNAAGVPDQNITIVVAVGAHRASTYDEKVAKLGQDVVERVRVVDPDACDPATLVDLGQTQAGVPIVLSKLVLDTDLLVATGIVEPHQYAGYSGGRKTVAIGVAGEKTIGYTHGPLFLDHPKTRLGNIDGNPFHEAVTEIARRAGLRFIVNVVADDNNRVVAVQAGEPEAAFMALVGEARQLFTVPIAHAYDIAIGGVGYPKDANLYQASRAPSYLFFAPQPVVRPGGIFITPALCQEGAGAGAGEQRFFRTMREAPSVAYILDHARKHGIAPGEQRAFVMAKVLEQNQVIIVGSQFPDVVREAKMIPAASMEEAFAIAQASLGKNLAALIVPHALLTLPVISRPLPSPPGTADPNFPLAGRDNPSSPLPLREG